MRATPLHVFSVVAFLALLGVLLYDAFVLAQHITPFAGIAGGVIACVLGYVLADLLSGIVHFCGDTFGSEHTPLFGKAFIAPFREHHLDQKAITHHGFFYVNGNNSLIALPVMLVLHFFLAPHATGSLILTEIFFLSCALILSVFLTNQIHKWAHQENPAPFIQFLQKHRIILSPVHHAKHHTPPFASHFCITTGWVNTLHEKIKTR